MTESTANPPGREEDLLLARRIQNGNERAFREMYRRYAPALLRRLVRMLGDPAQAEDCLQQVFLEAMRSIEKFEGTGSLQSWLNSIATYVVMGRYRKKKRFQSLLEKVRMEPIRNPSEAERLPEELLWKEDLRGLLWELLDKLSPSKRMVILLCDLEGESIEEAARQMKIPQGTVASRLYHARRELKKMAVHEFKRQGLSLSDLGLMS